jgi:hypothetical protein
VRGKMLQDNKEDIIPMDWDLPTLVSFLDYTEADYMLAYDECDSFTGDNHGS